MKPKLLYLTCIENILYSGVLHSQVIDLLKKMKVQHPDLSICLLSLIPIFNYFKYSGRRKKLHIDLLRSGIEFRIYPILFLTRFFYMKPWQIGLFLIQTLPILASRLWNQKTAIVHARSYPAALAAAILRLIIRFRLIFDMKGLYPAEGELLGRFHPGDFNMWLKLENRIAEQADHIIGVSPDFLNYISPQFTQKFSTVPCCVNPASFLPEENHRQAIRKNLNLDTRQVFVFSGSIGVWEQIQSLIRVFEHIKNIIPTAFLLVLTQTQSEKIASIFEKIDSRNYLIRHLPPEEVPSFLMAADFALIIRQQHLINKVSLTVKFGEYLAAGLPVIVTASTGEAARLVAKYQCGIVIGDENDPKLGAKIQKIFDSYKRFQENGVKLISEYLDIDNCVKKYLDIYARNNF